LESDGEFIMAVKYLSGNRLWGTNAERLAMSVSYDQSTTDQSRTFGVGGRKAVGVKILADHYLVGKTITQFQLVVNKDSDGAGTVRVYVIRNGSTPDDQEAESDAVTVPSTTSGNTTINTTFTFSGGVTILANDIISIVRDDAGAMTGMCQTRTTSTDVDSNAKLVSIDTTSATSFEYGDFSNLGTNDDLRYIASGASPSLPNGSIFITSDTNVHYMFDGTDTWNEVA